MESLFEELAREIDRIRRRHAALLREPCRPLEGRWIASSEQLRWTVPLEDVLEPDIDVEVERDVLIVRARPETTRVVLVGILPVPHEFDAFHPLVRYEEGFLEVRVLRARARRRAGDSPAGKEAGR